MAFSAFRSRLAALSRRASISARSSGVSLPVRSLASYFVPGTADQAAKDDRSEERGEGEWV